MTIIEKISIFLSSGFYLGFIPNKIFKKNIGCGTLGTILAAFLFYLTPSNTLFFSIFLVVFSLIAFYTADTASLYYKTGDDQRIVIDEILGYFISMAFLPREFNFMFLAFVFFRLYDGLKPWPIKHIDKKIKGGLGIILDDIVAGIFANITLRIFMN